MASFLKEPELQLWGYMKPTELPQARLQVHTMIIHYVNGSKNPYDNLKKIADSLDVTSTKLPGEPVNSSPEPSSEDSVDGWARHGGDIPLRSHTDDSELDNAHGQFRKTLTIDESGKLKAKDNMAQTMPGSTVSLSTLRKRKTAVTDRVNKLSFMKQQDLEERDYVFAGDGNADEYDTECATSYLQSNFDGSFEGTFAGSMVFNILQSQSVTQWCVGSVELDSTVNGYERASVSGTGECQNASGSSTIDIEVRGTLFRSNATQGVFVGQVVHTVSQFGNEYKIYEDVNSSSLYYNTAGNVTTLDLGWSVVLPNSTGTLLPITAQIAVSQ